MKGQPEFPVYSHEKLERRNGPEAHNKSPRPLSAYQEAVFRLENEPDFSSVRNEPPHRVLVERRGGLISSSAIDRGGTPLSAPEQMAAAPDITRSGHRRTSSPDLAAPVPLLPIHPVVRASPHVPMIEVGHPARTSSFSRESLVLVLLILLEIFLFSMLVLRSFQSADNATPLGH